MPNPKSKILFYYYPESARGLGSISAILNLLFAGHVSLARVVSCHAGGEICFPLEHSKHCLKVHRLLVVIISNVPSSPSCSHTQYQPISQIWCLDRFYILLAWQGQKDGSFSSLLCGVRSDPQAQMGVLPGQNAGP